MSLIEQTEETTPMHWKLYIDTNTIEPENLEQVFDIIENGIAEKW